MEPTDPDPTTERDGFEPSPADGVHGAGWAVSDDWAAALARHERWLRTSIRARLGGERQAVDEVLQEVAVAALTQAARPGELARVGAWLHRVALRQVMLYRRRCGRRARLLDRYTAARGKGEAEASRDPLRWLLADERRRGVREALERLPARDAEILWLKYSEGWSYRELAERLDVSESAVEARLHRARGRLREALADPSASEVGE